MKDFGCPHLRRIGIFCNFVQMHCVIVCVYLIIGGFSCAATTSCGLLALPKEDWHKASEQHTGVQGLVHSVVVQ